MTPEPSGGTAPSSRNSSVSVVRSFAGKSDQAEKKSATRTGGNSVDGWASSAGGELAAGVVSPGSSSMAGSGGAGSEMVGSVPCRLGCSAGAGVVPCGSADPGGDAGAGELGAY